MSTEGHRFESCSCLCTRFCPPSHPLSLTPGGGCTLRPILSFCINPVSREQPRGLHYMSHRPTHTHRPTYSHTQVSQDASIWSLAEWLCTRSEDFKGIFPKTLKAIFGYENAHQPLFHQAGENCFDDNPKLTRLWGKDICNTWNLQICLA